MQYLSSGSELQHGKYRIERVLGQGGFGITYLAENTMLEGKVAIKEFFFKEYCERGETTSSVTVPTTANREIVERFKTKFIKEARTIFRLSHPNIVRILDVFEENDTAYYVMEHIDGESLGDLVKRRGALPEQEALGYIRQAADALSYIHGERMNHLDVKPGNLMKRAKDGRVLLIDFGVAKQYDALTSEGTTTTPVGISHGYSPAEQYRKNGVQNFSPSSDVYALAATLFKLLTGNTPPEAMEVSDDGLPLGELRAKGVSESAISAIVKAMKGRNERTQSMEEFIGNLSEDKDKTPSPMPEEDESTIIYADLVAPQDHPVREVKSTEKTSDLVKTFEVKGVQFKMIKVLGGTFDMKETYTESYGFLGMKYRTKNRVQTTTLSTYWIGETQVTQSLWEAVMNENPSYFKGPTKPVDNVSWDDCKQFVAKLSSLLGMQFRLPTEAEWEYAARERANNQGCKFSGSNTLDNVAWFANNSEDSTHEVGTKQPNMLGLYDMSGNVWEWCSDWFGYYCDKQLTNPQGGNNEVFRVYRGGSWRTSEKNCSSTHRAYGAPYVSRHDCGLRLALSEQI